MDNQPWDKAKLKEWKEFWDSEMGQEAIKKMTNLKNQCFDFALGQSDPNGIAFYIGRAGGIDLILQDIEAGFKALEEMGKEDEQKKDKK